MPPANLRGNRKRRIAIAVLGAALLNFLVFALVESAVFRSGRRVGPADRQEPNVLVNKSGYSQVTRGRYVLVRVYGPLTFVVHLVGIAAAGYLALDRVSAGRRSGESRGAI